MYRNLRSNDNGEFTVHRINSRSGELAFGHAAVRLWNRLPFDVIYAPTLQTFKTRLKTHLFMRDWPTKALFRRYFQPRYQ